MSQGVHVLRGKCPGGKCPGGKCPEGICPWVSVRGVHVRGGYVLEPSLHRMLKICYSPYEALHSCGRQD